MIVAGGACAAALDSQAVGLVINNQHSINMSSAVRKTPALCSPSLCALAVERCSVVHPVRLWLSVSGGSAMLNTQSTPCGNNYMPMFEFGHENQSKELAKLGRAERTQPPQNRLTELPALQCSAATNSAHCSSLCGLGPGPP